MRYFTPELLIRTNSADEAVADGADTAWEAALTAYQARLSAIHDLLPTPVRRLADLCLHDAELLVWEQVAERLLSLGGAGRAGGSQAWSKFAAVSVKSRDVVTSIVYGLWDDVRESSPRSEFPFSPRQVDWLYDEVDVSAIGEGAFVHRILLADGRELEVPFTWVLIHRIPLTSAVPTRERTRQPA